LEPAITTEEPTAPRLGFKVLMLGGGTTANSIPALATPETVTTTLPVAAPAGTTAVILLALQEVTLAATPLKVTVPTPCVAPKLEPAITTKDPTGPEPGDRLLITGLGTLARVWNVVISCMIGAEAFPLQVAVCTPAEVEVALCESAASPEVLFKLFDNCTALYPVPAVKMGLPVLS
jgi:hypothetical protein